MEDTQPTNPWTPQDEGDHTPIKKEWWTTILSFTTPHDHHSYAFMTSMSHLQEPVSCFYQTILMDLTANTTILHTDLNDKLTELTTTKNRVDVRYKHTALTGLYPRYHLHNHDPRHGFTLDADLDARALPHWIAQETTNGLLPIGLNHYRYGFLPNLDLSGTMTLHDTTTPITGHGYLEHAYGNWSYEKPLQAFGGIRTTLATYLRLTHWWLSHHHHHLPTRIGFSTENNMSGYDWLWGICDNHYSFFFGNSLLYINDGPSMGALYVTPDGKHYWEFSDVTFHYHKLLYVKDYDVYYPSDMELTGRLPDKTIHLRFTSTTSGYEFTDPNNIHPYYTAFILGFLPGRIDGTLTYTDGRTIPLQGFCIGAPLREGPRHGHTAIHFTLDKPPRGLGITIDYESHPKKKKSQTILRLAPRPRLSYRKHTIDVANIPRETILP